MFNFFPPQYFLSKWINTSYKLYWRGWGHPTKDLYKIQNTKSEVWLLNICAFGSSKRIPHHPSGTTNPFMGSQTYDIHRHVVSLACTPRCWKWIIVWKLNQDVPCEFIIESGWQNPTSHELFGDMNFGSRSTDSQDFGTASACSPVPWRVMLKEV